MYDFPFLSKISIINFWSKLQNKFMIEVFHERTVYSGLMCKFTKRGNSKGWSIKLDAKFYLQFILESKHYFPTKSPSYNYPTSEVYSFLANHSHFRIYYMNARPVYDMGCATSKQIQYSTLLEPYQTKETTERFFKFWLSFKTNCARV